MTTTYPGGLWRPLGKATPSLARHDIVCVHTMVGSLLGTDAYFRVGSTGSNSRVAFWLGVTCVSLSTSATRAASSNR